MSLICPECGVPLVPFGGEDICMDYCDQCDGHDCSCGEPRDDDECECPVEGHMPGCHADALTVRRPQPGTAAPEELTDERHRA